MTTPEPVPAVEAEVEALRVIAQYACFDKFEERYLTPPEKHPAWKAADTIERLTASLTASQAEAAALRVERDAETIKAAQITMGRGLVDVTRIDHEGRSGILFRPRDQHIPVGEEGELQPGKYWPTVNDVVIWIENSAGAEVIQSYLSTFLAAETEAAALRWERDDVVGCLLAEKPFWFDPATNFVHADDGGAQGTRWEPVPQEEAPRCEHCDGTGDVHSIDGEWRGYCSCPAGTTLQADGERSESLIKEGVHLGLMPTDKRVFENRAGSVDEEAPHWHAGRWGDGSTPEGMLRIFCAAHETAVAGPLPWPTAMAVVDAHNEALLAAETEAAALKQRVVALEGEVQRVQSDREYIIGFNAGWEELIAQLRFPTMLRKMWSGGEVQKWIDEHSTRNLGGKP